MFILFLIPLIGLAMGYFVPKKIAGYIILASIILLAPLVTDYEYTIPYVRQTALLACGSALFSLVSREMTKPSIRIASAVLISMVLFAVLGLITFANAMAGSTTVTTVYKQDNYRVDYIYSQGFSGRPYIGYELKEYGAIPIFIKTLESAKYEDSTCAVNFNLNLMQYDRCKNSLRDNYKK